MSNASAHSQAGDCSRFKISETILKTGQIDALKAWYTTVLGVGPFYEHEPKTKRDPSDFGGQTRASDLRMCFFRLAETYPYTQVIGLFEEPSLSGLSASKTNPGLHHMQLMIESLGSLVDAYEFLKTKDMRPHRSANHGFCTSFYYRDPDGNNVELTCQNFPTFETMVEFMASPEFKANPSGVELDPDAFIAKFRSGAPTAELLRV